ncbi:TetR/AcrR family transcriptional regulator [Luminiphilus sp.]|jgi:AcrR family transcriptional regulator|nr:TetR/AcrR family transcriptional regulator [Luminiphilus sp.]MDB4582663.1 TetR/AcrR family transcriptional regulator [Draconibacterium sp.]MDA7839791.1 TetR/AcrR family transcriptional regulator [Luminiphilus sp.]MDB3922718.1 TetR/AcrR family transcriptional regulator [Luminiphilus sp.]MDC3405125.1 TetR/AcrR family transcriptional regulator [Luminiphilus sp.]
MPRQAFSAEEIIVQKQRIMDEAAQVMASEGISQLSMRALAASLNMTAANLYNYFPSKRQLFIETTQRGYELIDNYTKEGVTHAEEPREKLAGFLKSAVRFAHDWTGYWELMVHPPLQLREDLASDEGDLTSDLRQRTSDRMINLFTTLLSRSGVSLTPPSSHSSMPGIDGIAEQGFGPDTIWVRVITLLTNTHGLIDLYNHKMLDGFDVDVPPLIDALIDSSIDILLPALNASSPEASQ